MNRVKRQAAAVELRGLGLSLRDIAEKLHISHTTIAKDLRRVGVKPEAAATDDVEPLPSPSAPTALEPPVPSPSGSAEAAPETGRRILEDLDSAKNHTRRLYADFIGRAREGNMQAAQLCDRLIHRMTDMLEKEKSCVDHITKDELRQECAWLNGLWVVQLQVAARGLEERGVKDAVTLLEDSMRRVAVQARAGRV